MSATIDCMAVAEAGHVVPDGYGPIPVQTFLNNTFASENSIPNGAPLDIVRLFRIFFFLRKPFTLNFCLNSQFRVSNNF